MQTDYMDYAAELYRRKDEVAQAERYRLASSVPNRTTLSAGAATRLLARLGDLMVVWGCQLQSRFAVENGSSH